MDFDSHGPALTVRTLYNELGTDKIEALCRNFYEGLYSDDKVWSRRVSRCRGALSLP